MTSRSPPRVYDHKTTSDFKWAKTSDQLLHDVQATLYAAVTMHQTEAEHCDLQWTYLKTRAPYVAKAVTLRVSREDITPRLLKTIESAREMTAIITAGKTAADLPKSLDHCDAFGGCPYRDICLKPVERLESMSSIADLVSRLQSQKNGVPAVGINPPEAAASPPIAVVPAPAPFVTSNPTVVTPTVTLAAPEPKKRGRPAKTETVKAEEPAPVVTMIPDVNPSAAVVLGTLLRQQNELLSVVARIQQTTLELVRAMQ